MKRVASRVQQRVLGIDPGTNITGWGVVVGDGRSLQRVASGVLRVRGERAEKLGAIFTKIGELCETYHPDGLSLEQSFVGANVQTALRLGEARGSVMVAAVRAGVVVREYPPASIKMAVAGTGRADKTQVQAMVSRLLGIDCDLKADEADALAAAICDLNTSRLDATVGSAPSVGGPGRTSRGRARSARWR